MRPWRAGRGCSPEQVLRGGSLRQGACRSPPLQHPPGRFCGRLFTRVESSGCLGPQGLQDREWA